MAAKKKVNKDKQNPSKVDFQVLQEPVVTEKTSIVGGAGNKVVFRVDPKATKADIKKAVEAIFNVNVTKVNTMNMLGKVKRVTGSIGRQKASKKAYVTLAAGQTIDLVEGV